MTNFHGFCSYPHGGWALAGLISSCMAALGATMYAVASCRFVYIDFVSDRGNFGEFYLDPTADSGNAVTYRAGAGLYTWLAPFSETDWSKGQCTGYTERQTDTFGDTIFEVVRIFGVLSVLAGVGVTGWTLFLSCVSLGRLQIWAMSTILFLLTCFVGMSFLLFQTALCQDLVSYQDPSYTTECTLDQGGLVAIAACLLWCVAFFISVIYIKLPDRDVTVLPDGQIVNAFQQRQLDRERQKREKQRQRRKMIEQKQLKRLGEMEGQSDRTKSFDAAINSYADGMTEVQLGNEVAAHRGNHRGTTQGRA